MNSQIKWIEGDGNDDGAGAGQASDDRELAVSKVLAIRLEEMGDRRERNRGGREMAAVNMMTMISRKY